MKRNHSDVLVCSCNMYRHCPPLLILLADPLQVFLQVMRCVSIPFFVVHHFSTTPLWPAGGCHSDRGLSLKGE